MEVEAGEFHIRGLGDFDIAFGTLNDMDFVAEFFDETGFVGGGNAFFLGLCEGTLDELSFEDLRSLREYDAFARNGSGDERDVFGEAGALHLLDSVHRGNGKDGRVTAACFLNDTSDLFDSDEGTDGVVNDDEFRVCRNVFQGLADGALAGICPLHNQRGLSEFFFANAGIEFIDHFGAGGHDDVGDERARGDTTQGVDENGDAVEFEKLFGHLVAHARAETGSGQNSSDSSHR